MKYNTLLFMGLASIILGIIGLVLLNLGDINLDVSNGSAVERGAWIFNTGTDPNGQPIPFSGGMMMEASCAGCHGTNGHGLHTPMFTSPNITYRNLTDSAGMIEPDGRHGMTYTDELILRAVTQGIDAEGKPLDSFMPHWQLTNAEWNALLAYLKAMP